MIDETDAILTFSWIDGKDKYLMIRFPELLIVHVTENTNMKKLTIHVH